MFICSHQWAVQKYSNCGEVKIFLNSRDKSELHSVKFGKACYYSVQNLLPSRLLLDT